jgi:transposase-like protein
LGATSVAAVEAFNDRIAAKKPVWAWPTIGAALTSKFIWLIIACDSCGLMLDMDLTMKRRDPKASIRTALRDVTDFTLVSDIV